MTAIVATMNKNGIALAADSAGSVGYKIFSANKIFQIGDKPVGVAIYGGSEFMQIPVGIIVDAYSKSLGTGGFQTIEEYMSGFLEFLSHFSVSHGGLDVTNALTKKITDFILYRINQDFTNFVQTTGKTEITLEDAKSIMSGLVGSLEARIVSLTGQQFIDGEGVGVPLLPLNHGDIIMEGVTNNLNGTLPEDFIKFLLEETKLLEILKNNFSHSQGFIILRILATEAKFDIKIDEVWGVTGCIFFGFGTNELYPCVDNIELYYGVGGKIAYTQNEKFSITNQQNAAICPYAQKDTVMNLVEGISPTLQALFLNQTVQNLLGNGYTQADIDKLIGILKQSLDTIKINHFASQIVNTISFCSVGELAHIAETYVNLTSFKKRVTMVSEDVGGPTDVVVISKTNGFKWIKCKS